MSFKDSSQQGIENSIDQRKGYIEVNDQKLNALVFWTKTAPKVFEFKCYPKKSEGVMNIWNVWRNVEYKDNVDSWIDNAGLYIEQLEDNVFVFHCSSGRGSVNFDDLVFKVRIK